MLFTNTPEQLASAIYLAEGGSYTSHPYGIIIPHKTLSKEQSHSVCIRTINNNYRRWIDTGSVGSFIDFLADVYCPIANDKIGNERWKHNVKWLLEHRK